MGINTKQTLKGSATIGSSLAWYVTPQKFGAKADGITDDTKAIQRALNASSFVYIPDGTYMINATNSGWGHETEGGVYPKSNQTIMLSPNAKLKAIENTSGFYNVININNVNDVRIVGGKIEGERDTHEGTAGQHGYGIGIYASSNVTVEQVEISKCWGDSIFIGHEGGVDSKNVKVYDCTLHDSRRQGISIVGCSDAIIRGCEIYNISGIAPQYGIDIEPDVTGVAKNITIENCHIHDNGVGDIVIANSNNEIKGVTITGCTLDKHLNCSGGSDVTIDKCTVHTIALSSDKQVVCSNSRISEVYAGGGNGVFDNCDIKNTTNEHLILSALDNYQTKVSNMAFNNCRFVANDIATYLMLLVSTSDSTIYPEDTIAFKDCTFHLGTNCNINNRLAGNKTVFDGCHIKFSGTPYNVFNISNSEPTKFILNNTEVECIDRPSYIVAITAGNEPYIEISNCKLLNNLYFIYCGAVESGEVRLFNNMMTGTDIIGDNNLNVTDVIGKLIEEKVG